VRLRSVDVSLDQKNKYRSEQFSFVLKLDLPDNYFDGVFANASLFHVCFSLC
jgi:hypothetical protein